MPNTPNTSFVIFIIVASNSSIRLPFAGKIINFTKTDQQYHVKQGEISLCITLKHAKNLISNSLLPLIVYGID